MHRCRTIGIDTWCQDVRIFNGPVEGKTELFAASVMFELAKLKPTSPSSWHVLPLTQVLSCVKGAGPTSRRRPASTRNCSARLHAKWTPGHQQRRYSPPGIVRRSSHCTDGLGSGARVSFSGRMAAPQVSKTRTRSWPASSATWPCFATQKPQACAAKPRGASR